MAKVVYVISKDPKEETEAVSEVLAQALTSISFDYETEIFLMGEAVSMAHKDYLTDAIKAPTFESIKEMLGNYIEMEGKLYVCHPAADARNIHEGDCIEGLEFVNASRLVESGVKADALFTF